MLKYQAMKPNAKRILTLLSVLSLFSLAGCDMFRRLAGRPTAEEVEQMRIEQLKLEEARHRFKVDSLKKVEKALADSIAVLDSIKQMHGTILNPSEIGGLFTTKLDYRYYIVVGAFKSRVNAEELLSEVKEYGYAPILINFRNGFNAIGISPTDDILGAFHSLKKVREEKFCPEDVWILVNE